MKIQEEGTVHVIECEYRCNHNRTSKLDNLEEPRIQKPDTYTLHYIIEGDGIFRVNNEKHALRHDSVFITLPDDSYSLILRAPDISFTYYILTFQIDKSDQDITELLKGQVTQRRAFYPKRHLRNTFDELVQNQRISTPGISEASNHLVISLLYTLSSLQRATPITTQTTRYVEKSIKWMHENLYNRFTLRELCVHLNMTEAHFIRIFRSVQGIPPMKYFVRLKIDAAANLLLETGAPVYQIAETLEFNSPGHFCRTFKQYTGMSPSRFRNSETQSMESRDRKYQQRLEEAYNLLQTIIDASPDLVFFKDKSSVYMGCNEAFCKFTGLEKDQIIGRSDYDIHPSEKAEFFTKRDQLVFRNDRAFKNEETLYFPNGTSRLYQVYKAPFHDRRNQVIGLIGISRDISDLRENKLDSFLGHSAGPSLITRPVHVNSVQLSPSNQHSGQAGE